MALLPAQAQQPEATLRLASVVPLERPAMLAERRVLDRAFARAGLHYTLRFVPAERALEGLRSGEFDGDVSRTEEFAQIHPQALRVDPHLQNVFHYAFGRSPQPPSDWTDLQTSRLAYVRGFRAVERLTASVPRREQTSTAQACLQMARLARVDWCILGTDRSGRLPADVGALEPLQGYRIGLPLKTHLWLAPQRAQEAQRLTRELRTMAQSGELQTLMEAFRQPE